MALLDELEAARAEVERLTQLTPEQIRQTFGADLARVMVVTGKLAGACQTFNEGCTRPPAWW